MRHKGIVIRVESCILVVSGSDPPLTPNPDSEELCRTVHESGAPARPACTGTESVLVKLVPQPLRLLRVQCENLKITWSTNVYAPSNKPRLDVGREEPCERPHIWRRGYGKQKHPIATMASHYLENGSLFGTREDSFQFR